MAKENNTSNIDRYKILESTLTQIQKEFGKECIMRLGEQVTKTDVEGISTGSLGLDIAIGIGGIPVGRITEIFGPESSGKTTICLHIVANVQKSGGIAAFIDTEHALDPIYAAKLGVDVNNLLISQPDYAEQALEICDRLVRSGTVDCVIVDSVAALVPKAEIEGEMGEQTIGLQARLMSQALRKLATNISKTRASLVFTNQMRQKIGVMFGSPETTPGGLALKFYASVRLDIRKIENIREDDNIIGSRVRVKVVKNKVAPPFKQCEFDMLHNEGIYRIGEIVDLGVNENIIQKSGTWLIYKDQRLGQGRNNACTYLKEHPDLANEIENLIREKYLPKR
jgi:recombination protein RecA